MTQPQTALITGGSQGLGLALATSLAQQHWTLIMTGRNRQALEQARRSLAAETTVIAIDGDVTDREHRARLTAAAAELGGIDLLVNNASTLGASPLPSLLEFPLETLEQVYRTNVIAPLAIFQAIYPHLKADGSVMNITSDAAVEAYAGWGGYGSSKAGLEHLSAILAEEHPNLRIYWVDPGDMRTQMHQDAFPGEDISDRPLPEETVPGLLALIEGTYPSGRYQAKALPSAKAGSVRELRVVLQADRFDDTVRFYQDGLALPIVTGWNDPDGRGIVLSAGQATLEIIDGPQASRLERIESVGQTPPAVRLAFRVDPDQFDTTREEALRLGSKPVRDPIQAPWGHVSQRFAGPDGMALTLFRDADADELAGLDEEGVSG